MENLKPIPDSLAGYVEIYNRHYARVVRLSRLLLSDSDEAEDVSQDVFLKVFREYRNGSSPTKWEPWLIRVTVNACRDRRRSGWWKWSRASEEEFQEADHPSRRRTPEEVVASREARRRIWRSLHELSPRQKEVFVLRHLEGWSTGEVADTLGLTQGSVKRHLFRAARHLRKALRGAS